MLCWQHLKDWTIKSLSYFQVLIGLTFSNNTCCQWIVPIHYQYVFKATTHSKWIIEPENITLFDGLCHEECDSSDTLVSSSQCQDIFLYISYWNLQQLRISAGLLKVREVDLDCGWCGPCNNSEEWLFSCKIRGHLIYCCNNRQQECWLSWVLEIPMSGRNAGYVFLAGLSFWTLLTYDWQVFTVQRPWPIHSSGSAPCPSMHEGKIMLWLKEIPWKDIFSVHCLGLFFQCMNSHVYGAHMFKLEPNLKGHLQICTKGSWNYIQPCRRETAESFVKVWWLVYTDKMRLIKGLAAVGFDNAPRSSACWVC